MATIPSNISKDWQTELHYLTKYKPNKFYKRVGPLVVGIELISAPHTDYYCLYFAIYALWGNALGRDIKSCMSGPILLRQISNEIPFSNHDTQMSLIKKYVLNQISFLQNDAINVVDIISTFETYRHEKPLCVSMYSYLQACVLADEYKCFLYFDMRDKAESLLQDISKSPWDNKSFVNVGQTVSGYLNKIQSIMETIDDFKKEIEGNINTLQIASLKCANIIK